MPENVSEPGVATQGWLRRQLAADSAMGTAPRATAFLHALQSVYIVPQELPGRCSALVPFLCTSATEHTMRALCLLALLTLAATPALAK